MSHLVVGHACLDITMSRILRALRPQINSGALANGSIIGSVRLRCSLQTSLMVGRCNVVRVIKSLITRGRGVFGSSSGSFASRIPPPFLLHLCDVT